MRFLHLHKPSLNKHNVSAIGTSRTELFLFCVPPSLVVSMLMMRIVILKECATIPSNVNFCCLLIISIFRVFTTSLLHAFDLQYSPLLCDVTLQLLRSSISIRQEEGGLTTPHDMHDKLKIFDGA